MITSIQVPKVVYNILSNNDELEQQVGKRIFPIIADQTTNFPFITFERENITTDSQTKDYYRQDIVSFSINVVTQGYLEGLEIADIVRSCLEKKKLPNTYNLNITNCKVYSVSEDYIDDAYVQRISFECTVDY
jgi:hypothetical protein